MVFLSPLGLGARLIGRRRRRTQRRSQGRVVKADAKFNVLNKTPNPFGSGFELRPHGRKRKQMDEETQEKNSRGEVIVSNTISKRSIFNLNDDDEDIVLQEVLCRLPVKTLMKFKCVCKYWVFLIQEDASFIDMHLKRSKTQPGFLIANSKDTNTDTLMTADLLFQGVGGAVSSLAVHTIRKIDYSYSDVMLTPVNGLVCFFGEKIVPGVCICNLGTREVTPWIKSNVLSNLRKEERVPFGPPFAACTLGYDPSTKEHKVVGIWINEEPTRIVCEVLTVGDNEWRRIEEVPPHDIEYLGSSVYVNGSIYYTTGMLSIWEAKCKDEPRYLVAFDLGSEKFRAIRVPVEIFDQHSGDFVYYKVQLLELSGRLALLVECSERDDYHKLWLFDDSDKNKRAWTWNRISLKIPHLSAGSISGSVHPVLGTDQILLTPRFRSSATTCYSYNWRTKTLSKVEVSGISSGPCFSAASRNTIFFESLLPVQKRRVRAVGFPTLVPGHPVPPPVTSTRTTGGPPKSPSRSKCAGGKRGRESSKSKLK